MPVRSGQTGELVTREGSLPRLPVRAAADAFGDRSTRLRTHFLKPMYVRNETSVEWSGAARGVSLGHDEAAGGPRGQEIKEAGRMIVQGG